MSENEHGTLWLVVGPSGAGKDTLLDGARAALGNDPAFHFPTRDITRAPELGGEVYNALSVPEFEARKAIGAYCLSWGAHGLFYGIPLDIGERLSRGETVIVNVSRGVIDAAREQFSDVKVLSVTVPRAVLEARLRARGREDEADIARRLDRAEAFSPEGDHVVHFSNDRPRDESISAFVALLRG